MEKMKETVKEQGMREKLEEDRQLKDANKLEHRQAKFEQEQMMRETQQIVKMRQQLVS